METSEKEIELDAREAPKTKPMNQLQRAITKAWVLLLTNEAFIRQIAPAGRSAQDVAADLSGMNPAPAEIVDLVSYAISGQELVAGSGVSIVQAFDQLREAFKDNASSGWGGGGPHPGREELDATF